MNRFQKRKTEPPQAEAVRAADAFIARLASAVPVDLMPGQWDPSNWSELNNLMKHRRVEFCRMLPQRPLLPALFPATSKAGALGNLHFVTNPYDAEVGGW